MWKNDLDQQVWRGKLPNGTVGVLRPTRLIMRVGSKPIPSHPLPSTAPHVQYSDSAEPVP